MTIIYHDGPDTQELPDGLGVIQRGEARDVPEELAHALITQGGFQSVEEK